NLILQLGRQGHTIFLSSHLLHEVEQVCSDVAIINKGSLVAQGAVAQLLRGQGLLRLEVTPVATAVQVLRERLGQTAQAQGPRHLTVALPPERVPEAIQRLVEAGVQIYAVAPEQASLEDYFLAVTGDDAPAAPDQAAA